ncbi:hypothetical protein HPB51_003144 [Rhipicephalus microplus]|uniref:Uncharacterized protein n=1 Tax=Rhipicephalus microplus TaxID=6941 RepID=A0A9J6EK53_RHIMP|nr:hypothetical protein HPB51_003144 [Rhipicephalus microplus]
MRELHGIRRPRRANQSAGATLKSEIARAQPSSLKSSERMLLNGQNKLLHSSRSVEEPRRHVFRGQNETEDTNVNEEGSRCNRPRKFTAVSSPPPPVRACPFNDGCRDTEENKTKNTKAAEATSNAQALHPSPSENAWMKSPRQVPGSAIKWRGGASIAGWIVDDLLLRYRLPGRLVDYCPGTRHNPEACRGGEEVAGEVKR